MGDFSYYGMAIAPSGNGWGTYKTSAGRIENIQAAEHLARFLEDSQLLLWLAPSTFVAMESKKHSCGRRHHLPRSFCNHTVFDCARQNTAAGLPIRHPPTIRKRCLKKFYWKCLGSIWIAQGCCSRCR